jgi:hypothetical protein
MIDVAAVNHTIHSVQSLLPWDIPWNNETVVFFGITYSILGVIGLGLAYTLYLTLKDLKGGGHH